MDGRTPATVYVACAQGCEITALALDGRDGTLEPVQHLPVADGITPLVLGPSRALLFAGFRGERPGVVSYRVDPADGRLQQISSAPLDDPPMALATDAAGQFLLSASYAGATFTIQAIGHDGRIAPAAIEHAATPPRAHAIAVDPTNRFLFVTALGGDAILQYSFDAATGRVRPNAVPEMRTAAGCGPRHLAFHPGGEVLYVNGELDGSISAFALDARTGRLAPLGRASMIDETVSQPWAAEIAVHPGGRFAYASERRSSTLAIFDLRDDPGSPRVLGAIATEAQPRAFALDPDGRFLIVAGELSNRLTVYAVDAQTGMLEPRHHYPTAAKPVWVSIGGRRDAPGAP